MPIAQRRKSKFQLLTALLLSSLSLSLTQCGGTLPPPLGAEHCGGIACTGTSTCTLATNVPVCAVGTSGVCLSTGECAWKLNLSNGYCLCMEHDVRLCTASGGVPGVQICTKTSSASTVWASCVACPSCTAQSSVLPPGQEAPVTL
jgi:hypothetical protein